MSYDDDFDPYDDMTRRSLYEDEMPENTREPLTGYDVQRDIELLSDNIPAIVRILTLPDGSDATVRLFEPTEMRGWQIAHAYDFVAKQAGLPCIMDAAQPGEFDQINPQVLDEVARLIYQNSNPMVDYVNRQMGADYPFKLYHSESQVSEPDKAKAILQVLRFHNPAMAYGDFVKYDLVGNSMLRAYNFAAQQLGKEEMAENPDFGVCLKLMELVKERAPDMREAARHGSQTSSFRPPTFNRPGF